MKESLTKETLEAFQNDFRASTLHTVAKNAVTVNGLLKSSRNSEEPAAQDTNFPSPLNKERLPIRCRVDVAGCSPHSTHSALKS